ncbi:MAG: carboxylesterase family protein, partial [Proteobacteria bacterium]|nr:carboxylesterase family protein [Pseudomonadota bacterium]
MQPQKIKCCTQFGYFLGSRVSGLTYEGEKCSGTTNAFGRFRYNKNTPVTFSVGDLVLGTTMGKRFVTALDLVESAQGPEDARVNNLLVFLQTLDQNGNLNDGIQISRRTSHIVSQYSNVIDFDQDTAAFASDASVLALMDELNTAGVFTDNDPRVRPLRKSLAALEYYQRATSLRKIVHTRKGYLSGFEANETTWQFLGIPYARPPIGDLRWRPPQKAKRWHGIRDAIAWGDQAAQSMAMEQYGEGGMSEDCLYLNVTAPKNATGLPVMVWFHGGSFTILTGNTKGYNNIDALTTKDVVLVTVVHRLGPFGYLAHTDLAEESE